MTVIFKSRPSIAEFGAVDLHVAIEVFFINDNIKTFDGDGELRLTGHIDRVELME